MRASGFALLLLLAACTSEIDDDASAVDACEVAPDLSWDTFGDPFLLSRCQHCHGSFAADRHDAPPSITFDTMDDVRQHRARILASVVEGKMPPGGGLLPEEILNLEDWLNCDPCAEMSSAACEAAAVGD